MVAALAGLLAAILGAAHSGHATARRPASQGQRNLGHAGRLRAAVAHEAELPAALQDAAAGADSGGGVLLLGGLTPQETSVADVLRVVGAGVTKVASLPTALHDACAAAVGSAVYVFGGGEQTSFSGIVGVSGGSAEAAGSLPRPASDVGCATVGGTVYVVGGYTGQEPLRTILAWRPGGAAAVAGTLPKPLRYAAVGQVGGRVLIAGGTSGTEASRDVYSFDPASRRVREIARLPYPLTHAAGVAMGGALLVIGGRGEQTGTQRAGILSVSPDGTVAAAGQLPLALSDASVAPVGAGAIVAGGVDRAGRLQRTVYRVTLMP